MPDVPGPRAVLAPAGDPDVDQARVALQRLLRADPEPLGDTGPEALEEDVGVGDEVEQLGDAGGVLEVDREGLRPTPQGGVVGGVHQLQAAAADPLHPDHLGTQVGQHHRGVGGGPEALQLDHAHAGEGPAGGG